MGVVGFYEGVEELFHWCKYGDMNLRMNYWHATHSSIPCGFLCSRGVRIGSKFSSCGGSD